MPIQKNGIIIAVQPAEQKLNFYSLDEFNMAKTTETFDLRESIIPFSLLQISNHFKAMKPGEYIEIICSDETIAKDLRCILAKFEYESQYIDKPDTKAPEFCIRLRKINKQSTLVSNIDQT